MKQLKSILIIGVLFILISCAREKHEKGFQVSQIIDNSEETQNDGFSPDSLKHEIRPTNVLVTGVSNVRLINLYKLNWNKKDKTNFIGSNSFHYNYENYENDTDKSNNWNNKIIPGLEAVYGYNLVNISHYDIEKNIQKTFFDKPVLIKTLYYPTPSKDTLNYKPVKRSFFIVSVYDEDTNKDSFLNLKDLRRIYLFNVNGEKQKPLVPINYSVFKSEYDKEIDFLYIYAKLDANKNGKLEANEPIHVFWIDLKDPNKTGRMY